MKRFQNYLRDVIIELKKVTWPSWDELKGATVAVVIFSLISSFYVFVVDYGLMKLINSITDLFGAV